MHGFFVVRGNPFLTRTLLHAARQLMHSNSGVEKGMKAGGKPVEVMGLILGRPDTEAQTTLVVTDVSQLRMHGDCQEVVMTVPVVVGLVKVFPLPVEGAETKVLADDEEVTNYMINLSESLELVSRSLPLSESTGRMLCAPERRG
jgi:COP9 signalosome complex subunit 5